MKKAFTLIELLVVIVIIGVLATITAITINTVRAKARDTKRIADVRQVRQALDMYKNDLEVYPNAITPGQALVGTNGTTYMNLVPQNPAPRNDSGCPDSEYNYLGGAGTYSFTYCLNNPGAFGYPAGVIAATPGDIYGVDGYTVLLLHFNNGFTDSSSSGKVVTDHSTGNSSTYYKFGGNARSFTTNQYLSLADSSDWNLTGDFTIDTWMYTTSTCNSPSACGIVGVSGPTEVNNGYMLFYRTSLLNYYGFDNGVVTSIYTTAISANTWHHIAVVKSGSTATLYVDGVVGGANASGTFRGTQTYPNSNGLVISRMYISVNNFYWNGYLDELRISKGIARWTSNFTPPAREY